MKNSFIMTGVLCGLLCSCSGFKSSAPPPTVYVVKAESEAQEKPAKNLSVMVVPEPVVPAGFESDKIIVYLDGGRRLDYAAGANWPSPLAKMLQSFALQSAQSSAHVLAVSPDAAVTAAYRLNLGVNDFEPVYSAGAAAAPMLKVSLTFTLVSLKTDKVLDTFTLAKDEAASANSLSVIASGMESILRGMMVEAMGRIAPQMARHQQQERKRQDDNQKSEGRVSSGIENREESRHL